MGAAAGRAHWHGNHPRNLGDPHSSSYPIWISRFAALSRDFAALGVKVVNATRITALDSFEKVDLMATLFKKPKILVHGMHGLGDNLHQRSVVKHLMQTQEVFLETPWPCVYHDLIGDDLHVITKGSRLRTQAKNADREADKFYKGPFQRPTRELQVAYAPDMVRKHTSVLAAMSAQTGTKMGNFSIPVPEAWTELAEAALANRHNGKPILIYRPLMDRSEWGGCKARNPDHTAYARLFESIREKFFVISVADLVDGKEWLVHQGFDVDLEFHEGELTFEAMAGLWKMATCVFSSPGFAIVLAQAVGTPSVCVFGGYENSTSFLGGAAMAPYLGIDPINPCKCFSHTHACLKAIDIPLSQMKLLEFTHDAIDAKNRKSIADDADIAASACA